MKAQTFLCAAFALGMFSLTGLQGVRADVEAETSISSPWFAEIFYIYSGTTTSVYAASHHVASYINTSGVPKSLNMQIEYALTHSSSQDKTVFKGFDVDVNQTKTYTFDLDDAGPYTVGFYNTYADTTAQVGLALADAPIQVPWSVEGAVPAGPPLGGG